MSDIRTQLEAERRIIDAATEGPWEWQHRTMGDELTKPTLLGDPNDPDPLRRAMAYGHPWNILKTTGDWRPTEKDAYFIAYARTALPLRNAQVQAVLTFLGQLQEWASECEGLANSNQSPSKEFWRGYQRAYEGIDSQLRRAIEEAGG